MQDREALAGHGVFCVSVAAAMAAGVVLIVLLGFLLVLYLTGAFGGERASGGLLLPTVLTMKAGAVLGAVVGCWALHRLYWRGDEPTYRRRCARVGLVVLIQIVAAAALVLGLALAQPGMSMFRSPKVLPLFCLALLLPALFLGHVVRVWLVDKLLSSPVGRVAPSATDNPRDSARQMVAGLTRIALSPLVVIKTIFDGFLGLLDGCMHIDLGHGRPNERKKPLDPS